MTEVKKRLALTLNESAEACGVSKWAIEEAIRRGELVPRYPNSKPVIRVVDLDEWLENLPTERPAS